MVNPEPKVISEKLDNIASIISSLKDSGWLPVDKNRQPYKTDICDKLADNLYEDRFVRVKSSVCTFNGVQYFTVRKRIYTKISASDNPEDLVEDNKREIYSLVLQHLVSIGHTHIHKITVDRPEIYGYVPPFVWIYTESFGVPILS